MIYDKQDAISKYYQGVTLEKLTELYKTDPKIIFRDVLSHRVRAGEENFKKREYIARDALWFYKKYGIKPYMLRKLNLHIQYDKIMTACKMCLPDDEYKMLKYDQIIFDDHEKMKMWNMYMGYDWHGKYTGDIHSVEEVAKKFNTSIVMARQCINSVSRIKIDEALNRRMEDEEKNSLLL